MPGLGESSWKKAKKPRRTIRGQDRSRGQVIIIIAMIAGDGATENVLNVCTSQVAHSYAAYARWPDYLSPHNHTPLTSMQKVVGGKRLVKGAVLWIAAAARAQSSRLGLPNHGPGCLLHALPPPPQRCAQGVPPACVSVWTTQSQSACHACCSYQARVSRPLSGGG